MHTFADLAKALNRSTVYVSGLQSRFELPMFDGPGYTETPSDSSRGGFLFWVLVKIFTQAVMMFLVLGWRLWRQAYMYRKPVPPHRAQSGLE